MKIPMKMYVALGCLLGCSMSAKAQFYTIENVKPAVSCNPFIIVKDSVADSTVTKLRKKRHFSFFARKKRRIPQKDTIVIIKEVVRDSVPKLKVPDFLSEKDDKLLRLIKQRLTMCMPLDYIQVTSSFGNRRDPFDGHMKFHDGVDLSCVNSDVFSMLPGKVVKVQRSRSGYGNHVVLRHGRMTCLYGHLADIFVREGQSIEAGTVVGASGNTGRSTGPHLHVAMAMDGQPIDPMGFIGVLRGKLQALNEEIRRADPSFDFAAEGLSVGSLYNAMVRCGVKYPKIVIAQSLLETGYFSSRVCQECNNLFGLRRPSDGSYFSFNDWKDSVLAYKNMVQYKLRPGENYFAFLRRIGYAEDPYYVSKVMKIASRL